MKKITKLLISLILLCISQSIFAFPNRFTRLIGPKGKIVDLISEWHIKIIQPKAGISVAGPIMRKEGLQFTLTERRLIDMLKALNAKQIYGPIDLLWEATTDEVRGGCPLGSVFIASMGCKMGKLYDASKNQKITFIPADNFRRLVDYSMSQLRNLERTAYQISLDFKLQKVKKYLKEIQLAGDRYIAQIQNKGKAYKILADLWTEFTDKITQLETDFIQPYDQAITLRTFFGQLRRKNKERAFSKTWSTLITNDLPNFEILMKIIGSNKKHIILYAGAAHSEKVTQILENKFDFKKIIDIGVDLSTISKSKRLTGPLRVVLSATGIEFLQKKPSQSEIRLLKEDILPLFAKTFSNRSEDVFLGNLQTLKQAGEHAFINFFNLQEASGRTLAHVAAAKGWERAIDFLLDQPNISVDIKGGWNDNTILHTAIEADQTNIVKKLLQKGASKHIVRNKFDFNALDIAAENGFTAIAKTLLKHGSRINEQGPIFGRTALHWAARNKYVARNKRKAAIRQLLKRGANTHLRDKSGKRAQDYAPQIFKEVLASLAAPAIRPIRRRQRPICVRKAPIFDTVIQNITEAVQTLAGSVDSKEKIAIAPNQINKALKVLNPIAEQLEATNTILQNTDIPGQERIKIAKDYLDELIKELQQ